MTTTADAEAIARDPVARWFEPASIAAVIAPALAQALGVPPGTRVLDAALHQSRRRLSRRTELNGEPFLDLVYLLQLEGPEGRRAARWCHVQACRRGRSADVARSAAGGRHLEAFDAAVWPIDADPRLDQATAFLDAPGDGVDIVRYEPRTHIVARFGNGAPAASPLRGAGHGAVWGKAYADETWREVARRLVVLWPHGEQQPGAFAVARPAGADAALRAVWQDEVIGEPLRARLADADGPAWLARAALGLARLQALAPLSGARLDPPVLLERARKQAKKLSRADTGAAPSLAPPLVPLLRHLEAHEPACDVPCNVHGDFHVDQLRHAGGRLFLFDLDGMALGHAAHDVADFASQLLTDPTLEPLRRTALARGFVDAALRAGTRPLDAAALDWHLRVLLLRKAYSLFVRHRAGWPRQARHAIALAVAGLGALDSAAAPLADTASPETSA